MTGAPAGVGGAPPDALWRTLWRLAWPVAITGQLAVLSEGLLIFWIGRLLGPGALAVEASLRPAIQTLGWMLLAAATGASVLVAQSVGARDGRGLAIAQAGLGLVAAAWLALAALALPLAGPLAAALAAPQVSAADVQRFGLPLLLVTVPSIAALQVLLFAAAGAGWTRLSLTRMVADLGLSAAIVPVAVLALGLPGAPLGQGICQLVMLALVWRALVRQRARWHLGEPGPAAGLWRGERWRELIAVGLPPQLARIAMFAAYAIVVQHVAEDGPAAVAGYGIAFLVLSSAITVGSAVGRAVAIVLGQSVGAGDRARAARAARAGLVAAVAVGAGLGLALAALAGPLVGILAPTPAIAEPAARALRGMALALPLLGIAQVLLFAVTALKAAKRVSLLSAAADAVTVAIALAWPGASHLDGAIWAICAGSAVRALALGLAGRAIIARALAALPRPGGST